MVTLENVFAKDVDAIVTLGFKEESTKSPHEIARFFAPSVTLVLYKSGKLLLQGNRANEVSSLLKENGIGHSKEWTVEKGIIIGSDEALKGDTFGGLIVAAVKANDSERENLIAIGVKDSKKLSEKDIRRLPREIMQIVKYHIEELSPLQYNELYEYFSSQTKILNQMHSKCIEALRPGKSVVDQYPGCSAGDLSVTKGEEKYVEIAAASILARVRALDQIEKISQEYNIKVPLGSTHVKEAIEKASKLPLKNVLKLHFGNVSYIK